MRQEIDAVIAATQKNIQQCALRRESEEAFQKGLRRERLLQDMSLTELRHYFHPGDNKNKQTLRGLQKIEELAVKMRDGEALNLEKSRATIAELERAVSNNARLPIPARMEVLLFPKYVLQYSRNSVLHGKKEAGNVATSSPSQDPQNSLLWSRPLAIGIQDLNTGYGRTERPWIADNIGDYESPKTGYGRGPGFEMKYGKKTIKIKFHETKSEPFNARIFHALGYHVEACDYTPRILIKYDRRMLREFNLRSDLDVRLTLFGFVPVHTIHLQPKYDPFKFIRAAHLKDGTIIRAEELKAKLLRNPRAGNPQDDPDNYNADYEFKIDYLEMAEASFKIKDKSARNMGSWDFESLNHPTQREFRGLGLLAAWVGWYDARFDNTKIKVVTTSRGEEVKLYFSDLGGGLGKATGLFYRPNENPGIFESHCTRSERSTNLGKGGTMQVPVRIVHYTTNTPTPAFYEMTLADARWMASMIAELTERQIEDALTASGFCTSDIRELKVKLLSRRTQLLADLQK
jgi:hypothetical protein